MVMPAKISGSGFRVLECLPCDSPASTQNRGCNPFSHPHHLFWLPTHPCCNPGCFYQGFSSTRGWLAVSLNSTARLPKESPAFSHSLSFKSDNPKHTSPVWVTIHPVILPEKGNKQQKETVHDSSIKSKER